MTRRYPLPPYCTKGSTLCTPVSTLLFSWNYILSMHTHTSCVYVILIYLISFHSCMVFYLGSMQHSQFNQCPIHGHFSRFPGFAVTNSAAVKRHIHMALHFPTCVSLPCNPRHGIAGSKGEFARFCQVLLHGAFTSLRFTSNV